MTEPGATVGSPPSSDVPSGPGSPTPIRAGEPAPPGTYEGRARSFREAEAERRRQFRDRVEVVVIVVIVVLGIAAILTARPFNPSNGSNTPPPGPPITVNLTRSGSGNVTCGNGATAYTEQVLYSTPDGSVTTGDVAPRVYEAFDQDLVPDVGVVANATPTSVCAGSPPSGTILLPWYIVLAAPNGTNLLSFTNDQGWKSITNSAWNFPIENGTSLILVTPYSLPVGTYGLAIVGFVGGSTVHGSVLL